jgi:hypothetical protein
VLRTLVKWGGCSFVTSPVVYCLNDQYADFRLCAREGYDGCQMLKQREIARKEEILKEKAVAAQ